MNEIPKDKSLRKRNRKRMDIKNIISTTHYSLTLSPMVSSLWRLVSQTTEEKIPWEGEFTIRSDP